MLVIGHRGAAGHAPENTIEAFQKGLDFGCQMLEFDIRPCRSGEIVVFHDATLERMAGLPDAVEDMPLSQLQKLSRIKIPTLAETLTFINNRAIACIEVKEQNIAAELARELKHANNNGIDWENIYVISFFHGELLELRKNIPQIKIGPTICGMPYDYARFAYDIDAYAIHPCIHFLDQEFVNDAHNHGLKVYPWTADNEIEIRKAWQLGVDGITSNYPDRVELYSAAPS